jgi:hypothetical protein
MKKFLFLLAVMALTGFMAIPAFSADKLIVQDSTGTNTLFAVEDGTSAPNRVLRVLGGVPLMQNTGTAGFDFKNTAASFGASVSVGTGGNPNLYANWLASTNAKDDTTKVSWGLRLDVANDKFRVVRVPPASSSFTGIFEVLGTGAITSVTGASLTSGGVWTDHSSRTAKDNIAELSAADATETLKGLTPVTFNYKVDKDEHHVGFIAEDVPDLVATKDRRSLSPMDIVAVLTKVVQDQQGVIKDLEQRLLALEGKEK